MANTKMLVQAATTASERLARRVVKLRSYTQAEPLPITVGGSRSLRRPGMQVGPEARS